VAENDQGGISAARKMLGWLQRRRRAARAYQGFTQPASEGPLQDTNWREFQLLIGDAFRLQGYHIVTMGADWANEGADLVLRRSGKTLLAAYRHWNVATVGPEPVHDLRSAIKKLGADGGMLLTLGNVSAPARAAAQAAAIDLLDGERLVAIIRHVQATRMAHTAPGPLLARGGPGHRHRPPG